MFFKNAIIYQLTDSLPTVPEINTALSRYQSRPCGAQESATFGFTAPIASNPDLMTAKLSNGSVFICAQKEEKVIPAQAVKDLLQKKVAEIEEKEARKLAKKEIQRLKDEIIFSILPTALTKSAKTYAYIDFEDKVVVVDAGSTKKAEDVLSLLRKALGSLPVVPLQTHNSPTYYLTRLVTSGTSAQEDSEFTVSDTECELRGLEGEIIRLKDIGLDSEEVQNHLEAGKEAVKVGLKYQDRSTFTLTGDLQFKKLKLTDVIHEAVAEMEPEDEVSQFNAEGLMLVAEIRSLIAVLGEELGGLVDHSQPEEDLA